MTDLAISELTSVADIARQQADIRPEKIAFMSTQSSLTYAALNSGASQAANGFLSLGLKPNDRICYLGKNTAEYYQLIIAASKANFVMCPVNWRLALRELTYIISDAQAEILFVSSEFAETALALKDAIPGLEHIFCVEENTHGLSVYGPWRDQFSDKDPNLAHDLNDDAVQLYTSGTTGNPKGAVIPNRGLLESYRRRVHYPNPDWNVWTDKDISLVAMPCFHIGGTSWGLTTIGNGATGVIMREFDPTLVLDYIAQYKISKIFLVPAAIQFIVNQPQVDDVDFSQLNHILYGASPIPLALLKRAIEVFDCGFVQMYGMTETSGTIVALPPEDHDVNGNKKMSSAGKALEGVELTILDENGNALGPRETGEIATRSPMNMTRYWNLPEATQKTLSTDGWLRTGDAGYLDEDGYVFIQDRVKDMIISGGENIYPAEVENAIYDHPDITDVGVIGIPDEKWGEAVKACVVRKEGATLSEADVISWARENIAAYKCPKSVDFIDSLPRNPSGKILRKDLRAPYWDANKRNVN